jgi:hypothetical protein
MATGTETAAVNTEDGFDIARQVSSYVLAHDFQMY